MKNKKGFTLIELLAVIIILGVLMIIAIPSVTRYIQDSRKNAYITTAENFIDSARVMANSGGLPMYDTNTTYYIPKNCISLEKGGDSPYGEFTDAYVAVTYNGNGYDYYWTSTDETNNGIYLTYEGLLDSDSVMSNVESVSPTVGVGERDNIVVFDEGTCNTVKTTSTASDYIEEHGKLDSSSESVAAISFAEDSWDTIIKAVKSGKYPYKVGDTKTIDVGTYGTHTVRVANTSKPSECSTSEFSQSACGFVIEFADIITDYKMNNSSSSNAGGWPVTSMRAFLNDESDSSSIIMQLPEELRKGIISTTVVSGHGNTAGESNFITSDKLYLLAPHEVWVDGEYEQISSYDTAYNQTRQLDYYKNLNVTTSSNYAAAVKKKGSTVEWWWLRGARSSWTYFLAVYSAGYWGDNPANYSSAVSPAFRIG